MPRKTTTKKSSSAAKPTKSDLMWDAIKNLPINMFSLPNQKVSDHVERVKVSNDQVHLRLKSSSVVAQLEKVLARGYKMEENVGEFVVVSQLTDSEKEEKEANKQRSVVVEVTDDE